MILTPQLARSPGDLAVQGHPLQQGEHRLVPFRRASPEAWPEF
jgi:hypothetical protein